MKRAWGVAFLALLVVVAGAVFTAATVRRANAAARKDSTAPEASVPPTPDIEPARVASAPAVDPAALAQKMRDVVKAILPRFAMYGSHRGAYFGLLHQDKTPEPIPEVTALIDELRALGPGAMRDAIEAYLREALPLGDKAWELMASEYIALAQIVAAARDAGVDGRSLLEVSRSLLALGDSRAQLGTLVPAAYKLREMGSELAALLDTRPSAAIIHALKTCGSAEHVPDLIACSKKWKNDPLVEPALFALLDARRALEAFIRLA